MNIVSPKGPQRIVCLTEEPTEILYALGEGHRVVGISAYTLRPPIAKEKPVVSAFIGGSVKKILKLKPDLVIGFSDIQADLAADLIRANLQVLIFNQRSLNEILEVILSIGNLVGAQHRANDLVNLYITNLEKHQTLAAKRSYRPRVYFEEWMDPIISGIHWVSELIEIVGGNDIFSDRAKGKLAQERFVTVQEIIERDPEVYLASWCGEPFNRKRALERFSENTFSALRNNHIVEIAPEIILQPGPACLTDGIKALENAIFGKSE